MGLIWVRTISSGLKINTVDDLVINVEDTDNRFGWICGSEA